jgi:hypothetical protein
MRPVIRESSSVRSSANSIALNKIKSEENSMTLLQARWRSLILFAGLGLVSCALVGCLLRGSPLVGYRSALPFLSLLSDREAEMAAFRNRFPRDSACLAGLRANRQLRL